MKQGYCQKHPDIWDGTPVLLGPSGTLSDDYGQELIDVLKDDLDTETGRSTDAYSSRLRQLETDEKLLLAVCHQDLVPAEDSQ